MTPGESQRFEGRMDVDSANNPAVKWYTGTIRATTVYAGVYQITTPAGAFRAALITTAYEIEILSVVSVRDTLYTSMLRVSERSPKRSIDGSRRSGSSGATRRPERSLSRPCFESPDRHPGGAVAAELVASRRGVVGSIDRQPAVHEETR